MEDHSCCLSKILRTKNAEKLGSGQLMKVLSPAWKEKLEEEHTKHPGTAVPMYDLDFCEMLCQQKLLAGIQRALGCYS